MHARWPDENFGQAAEEGGGCRGARAHRLEECCTAKAVHIRVAGESGAAEQSIGNSQIQLDTLGDFGVESLLIHSA